MGKLQMKALKTPRTCWSPFTYWITSWTYGHMSWYNIC